MAKVNFYLLFNGNCEEAFNFYKSVFNSEFLFVGRYGDIPAQEGMPPIPDEDKNKIENICLPIGNVLLMGADAGSFMLPNISFGNNFSIYLEAESREEADKIFTGLSAGGIVTMPLTTAHWGDYFGMLTDKFGTNWVMNFSAKNANL